MKERSGTTWTPARIARLIYLYENTAMSCTEIANELGGWGTATQGGRSAVIGKAHRLNLTRQHTTAMPKNTPTQPRKRRRNSYKVQQPLDASTTRPLSPVRPKPGGSVTMRKIEPYPDGHKCSPFPVAPTDPNDPLYATQADLDAIKSLYQESV